MKPKHPSRSPLREAPLRNPAESLERHIDKLINEDAMSYIVGAVGLMAIMVHDWLRYIFNSPPNPYVSTTLGVIFIPFCVWRVLRIRKELRYARLGRDGEKIVGQGLELLREQGAKVFHDVPGGNFNLDHIVIAPTGIFVVETKTFSKPVEGKEKLSFDGTHITLASGYRSDKAVIQAQAAAHWLCELLKERTGKKFHVWPIIAFPGWFVETKAEAKNANIWVLNPKALPTYIGNHRGRVSPEDVALVAHSLSTYIRNHVLN